MRAHYKLLGTTVLAAALALNAFACASDPNKEVRNAESNLAVQEEQARASQAQLQDKQAQEQMLAAQQIQPLSNDDRGALQTKQEDEQADTKADAAKEVAAADKDVTKAYANMQQERATVEADAKARFEKDQSKANELKNKSAKIPAAKKTKWMSEWNTYESKKSEAQTRLSNLSRVSNDEWKDAKNNLQKSLDDLDAIIGRLDF